MLKTRISTTGFFGILMAAFFMINGQAFAAPPACDGTTEGTMVYNADFKVMQYCDGTNWISMQGGATAETDPEVGTLTNTKWCTTDGSTINCTEDAPSGGISSCTRRLSGVGSQTPSVSCSGGEIMTGGGCERVGMSGQTFQNYPSGSNTWYCQGNTTMRAYAICCS